MPLHGVIQICQFPVSPLSQRKTETRLTANATQSQTKVIKFSMFSLQVKLLNVFSKLTVAPLSMFTTVTEKYTLHTLLSTEPQISFKATPQKVNTYD